MASPQQPSAGSSVDALPGHSSGHAALPASAAAHAAQHAHGQEDSAAMTASHAAERHEAGQDQHSSTADQQDHHAELVGPHDEEGVGEAGGAAAEQRPCCSGQGSAEGEAGEVVASPSSEAPGTSHRSAPSAGTPMAASSAAKSAEARTRKGQASSKGQAGRGPSRVLPLLLLGAVAVPAFTWLRRRLAEGRQAGGDKGAGASRGGSAATAATSSSGKKPKQRGGKAGQQQQGIAAAAAAEEEEEAPLPPPAADALPTLLPVAAALAPPPPPPAPYPALPLASLRLVAAEDVDVAGAPTTFGLSHLPTLPHTPAGAPLPSPAPAAAASAPAVSRLVSAGAVCIGKTAVQPLSQELVGANVGTPLNRYRSAGGGSTGAPVAVASGIADLAVCADSAGEARVPAACCGLYALRPTPGTLGAARAAPAASTEGGEGEGAAGAAAAASKVVGLLPHGLALLARDTATLTKAADVMKLPGSANLRGEILKFVVAQDLFELCAPELQPATLAVKKAILRWAGAEQAGAVQLVQFLASNTSSWLEVEAAVKKQEAAREAQRQGQGQVGGDKEAEKEKEPDAMLHPFIRAAIAAAQALSVEEQWRGLSQGQQAWLSAATQPNSAVVGHSAVAGHSGAAEAKGAKGEGGAEAGAADAADALTGADGEAAAAVLAEANGDAAHGADKQDKQDKQHTQEGGDSTSHDADAAPAAADASPAVVAVPPAVAALARPSSELVKASVALAKEVADVLRQTVKPDTLLVLPALPFAPPRRPFATQAATTATDAAEDPAFTLALNPASVVGDDPGEYSIFSKLVRCFHAFASLGGCPSLTCPVGTLRDGAPVSITVVGVAKWDQRLLAAAGKLVPMIHDCFRAVKEEITAMAVAERQQAAAAAAAAVVGGASGSSAGAGGVAAKAGGSRSVSSATSASGGGASGAARNAGAGASSGAAQGNGRLSNLGSISSTGATGGSPGSAASSSSSLSAAVDPKRVEKAEKFKAKGNQLYSAGKYLEAVTEYTKAINAHPQSPVYFNNRAMACIKLFRFEQAEEDCCKALSFPDLPEKDRVKALLRRATARDALQRPDDAERDLKEVLRLEPGNRQAREDLAALRRHKEEMGAATAAMVQAMRQQQAAGGGGAPMVGAGPDADRARAAAALAAAGLLPPGFDPATLPPGLDAAAMLPPGFDPSQLAYSGEGAAGY